jgi:hypothetical protein
VLNAETIVETEKSLIQIKMFPLFSSAFSLTLPFQGVAFNGTLHPKLLLVASQTLENGLK